MYMYGLINDCADLINEAIDPIHHINPYTSLLANIRNVDVSEDVNFQTTYKSYWKMTRAVSNPQWYLRYFELLQHYNQDDNFAENELVEHVVRELYLIPAHVNRERRSVQFSFATKLVHMLRPHYPVFDGNIRQFYFLPEMGQNLDERLEDRRYSQAFLVGEYERILEGCLMAPAINSFRNHFGEHLGPNYTDEKVIDTILWRFVALLKSGAIRDGAIVY